MLEDGFKVIVPTKYKWHESQTKNSNSNFINKLNLANYNLLLESLDRLTKPVSQASSRIKSPDKPLKLDY